MQGGDDQWGVVLKPLRGEREGKQCDGAVGFPLRPLLCRKRYDGHAVHALAA